MRLTRGLGAGQGKHSPGDVRCFGKSSVWNVDIGRVDVADVIKEVHVHEVVVALQIIGLKATVLILQGSSCLCPVSCFISLQIRAQHAWIP